MAVILAWDCKQITLCSFRTACTPCAQRHLTQPALPSPSESSLISPRLWLIILLTDKVWVGTGNTTHLGSLLTIKPPPNYRFPPRTPWAEKPSIPKCYGSSFQYCWRSWQFSCGSHGCGTVSLDFARNGQLRKPVQNRIGLSVVFSRHKWSICGEWGHWLVSVDLLSLVPLVKLRLRKPKTNSRWSRRGGESFLRRGWGAEGWER